MRNIDKTLKYETPSVRYAIESTRASETRLVDNNYTKLFVMWSDEIPEGQDVLSAESGKKSIARVRDFKIKELSTSELQLH